MSSPLWWVRAAAAAALVAHVAGQQCYYPNGKAAPPTEKPCSSAQGSACCPDNWQCLDNGLCHYPPDNLWGRYSCSDKDWKSPGCASNLCTYGMNAPGGESITQCSNHNDDWCCNGDATNVNCCQESPAPRPFFAIRDGQAYATIGTSTASSAPTLSGITGLATPGNASPTQPSAGSRQPSVTPNAVSSTAKGVTSVGVSLSTGTAGVATVYITSVVMPTAPPTSGSTTGGNSNLGLIIGCAVGVPLALALAGIIFWLCRRRRDQKSEAYKQFTELDGNSPTTTVPPGGAAARFGKNHELRYARPGTAEIDGNPVGVASPISAIPGHAELATGQTFQAGRSTAYAPDTVGLGGGNSNRTTLNSSAMQHSPHKYGIYPHAYPFAMELDGTSVTPVTNEKNEKGVVPQPPEAPSPLNRATEKEFQG